MTAPGTAPTFLLECSGQGEEIGREETQVGVLDVVPYDWDQPAARELQVVPEGETTTSS